MEQLGLFNQTEKDGVCLFTGHRELDDGLCLLSLSEEIEKSIKSGTRTFLCGMAVGFDLLAAETLLSFKEKYPDVRLIACIPCEGQEKYFSTKNQEKYFSVLQKADEKIVLSPSYFRGCMQARDKYMAERANSAIAYCKKQKGGTAYTVKCFQKLHPDGKIVFL